MSRWFRHYAGMARDDKLVRVALKAGQPIERVVWLWAAILESAAEIDDDGRYDIDPAEVAYFLRSTEDDIRAVEAALAAAGRVAEGRVVKWGDRQFKSDRSASRQDAYRERKRARDGGCDDRETSQDHDGDGEVTAASRHGDAPENIDRDIGREESSFSARAPEPSCRIEFDYEFWPAYPHHVGRPKALTAFIKARQKATLAEILDGLARYRSDKPPDRQWLNPANFLDDERWKDEPAPAPARQPNGKPEPPHDPIFRALAKAAKGGPRGDERPPDLDAGALDFQPGEGTHSGHHRAVPFAADPAAR